MRMRRERQALVETLKEREWDLCFFGHSLTHELAKQPTGFVAPNADFIWAVDSISMERSRSSVGSTQMWWHSFITPRCRFKRGSTSSLNDPKRYDTVAVTRPLVSLAWRARDHWWKLRA
jgi:hypothetical protein